MVMLVQMLNRASPLVANVSGIYEVGEFGKLQLQLPTEDK